MTVTGSQLCVVFLMDGLHTLFTCGGPDASTPRVMRDRNPNHSQLVSHFWVASCVMFSLLKCSSIFLHPDSILRLPEWVIVVGMHQMHTHDDGLQSLILVQ